MQGIGDDLRKALAGVDAMLPGVRQTLDNADKLIEPNSPLDQELTNTLHEVVERSVACACSSAAPLHNGTKKTEVEGWCVRNGGVRAVT